MDDSPRQMFYLINFVILMILRSLSLASGLRIVHDSGDGQSKEDEIRRARVAAQPKATIP
jgi:hypothetical protein